MIRPVTIATFLMACGSGLYLYQSKHEAQLLDRAIEHTVHDTAALREQTRLLATEFTMLANPERLRQFSDEYLALKSIDPKQFTSMTELDAKLPAIVVPPKPEPLSMPLASVPSFDHSAIDIMPVSAEVPQPVDAEAMAESVGKQPEPPRPAATVTALRPADKRIAAIRPPVPDVPRAAEARAETHAVVELHAAPPRTLEFHPDPRIADARPAFDVRAVPVRSALPPSRPPLQAMRAPAAAPSMTAVTTPVTTQVFAAPVPPRPATVAAAVMPAAAPYGGSLLGMARGVPAAPRPTPAVGYNAN